VAGSSRADQHTFAAEGPPFLTLFDEAVRLSGHGESALGYGHLKSRFGAQRRIHFALGVPAGLERGESCLLTYGFIGILPFVEMLGPTRDAYCAAHFYMSSPDCCMPL
jgi:hypothetical protein